jgi:hypothetical protein
MRTLLILVLCLTACGTETDDPKCRIIAQVLGCTSDKGSYTCVYTLEDSILIYAADDLVRPVVSGDISCDPEALTEE